MRVKPPMPQRMARHARAPQRDASPMPGRHEPLVAHGSRTVVDHVAPAAIERQRTHLWLDDQAVRVLALTEYPRTVTPNWLDRLIDFDAPLDLTLHLEPLDASAVIRRLTHKLVELQSSRLLDAHGGRIHNAEREVAYEDVERLRDALQRGEEGVFSAGLYLVLRERTLAGLDALSRRVEATLGGLLAGCRPATFEHLPGLRTCLPAGRDELHRRRNLDTSSVATMLPFASRHLSMDQGLLAGIGIDSHALVIIDPFARELDNANKVVFATSGAGKSYACKVEALRALLLGIASYVIDPEDEYRRICEAVGGQFVRLTGSSPHHLNPFDLPPAADSEHDDGGSDAARDPLAEKILTLHGLLGLMLAERGGSLTQAETGALDAALYETYRQAGITPAPRTHHRLAPVLADLHAVLVARGNPCGLADRLARYVDGSLGHVFSSRTSVHLDHPFVVFGVRDLEPELRPLGIYLIADYLWREVRRRRAPRLLLIDEAWQLIQHPAGARFLAGMARQARKHYLGLITITQDVADFLGTPEGHTVLANAATRLLLRQDASTIDAITHTFQLSSGERQFLLSCGKGEGLFMARGNRVALRVVASPRERALATTDPAELAAMERERERERHREGAP